MVTDDTNVKNAEGYCIEEGNWNLPIFISNKLGAIIAQPTIKATALCIVRKKSDVAEFESRAYQIKH